MPTAEASGTYTPAALDTEYNLNTAITTTKTLIFEVDTVNLANGETVTFQVKVTVLAAGANRVAYQAIYKHVQAEPIKVSIPIPSDVSYQITIKQSGGTARAYPWKIFSI